MQFVQDETHIATKLRNRLLNEKIELTMGTTKISINHLKWAVKNVHKSVHGLTMYDACPFDRQNFRSFEKIVEERVIQTLQTHAKGSEATVQYLKICKKITSSFLDFEIPPLERILRMFHAVYFLRIWKNHILKSSSQTLHKNFISHNAYSCIEINAKSLIDLIKRFRNENLPELFVPTIFDSQTCEKFFRQLRSMGSMSFTRINFSLYELLHMIGRTEVQNSIAYFKIPEKVIFPLSHKRAQKTKIHLLPSDEEIIATLEKAKHLAVEDARQFGMHTDNVHIESYQIRSRLASQTNNGEDDEFVMRDDDDDEDDVIQFNYENDDAVHEEDEQIDYDDLDTKSPFTYVVNEDGSQSLVRKSCLVWMLTEPGIGLSKDRLQRVQVGKKRKK